MARNITTVELKNIALFQHLTDQELKTIVTEIQILNYKKNTEIYQLGVEPEYVYIVDKGSVKLAISAANGKALTKEIVYDMEIFNENVFTQNPVTQEYAEAMTETTLYAIPVHIFRQLAKNNTAFANEVMAIILSKLQHIESRLQNFVFCNAKERIINYLYRAGLRRGIKIGQKECLISHGITHKEISFLTDTSRQTVARILNELKRDNFIHYGSRKSSKILIRDMATLQHFA